jgi:hypothetical protein
VTEPGQHCAHPWLRVTCGVCGEAVDALGETPGQPDSGAEVLRGGGAPRSAGRGSDQTTFIVARGHPELIDQLRALMGHESGFQVIEDRRQRPREEVSTEEAREMRKRLREEGPG